jgi:hypothetical protein
MNTIDNGIREVVSIERIITDTKLCFKVTFKDWYGYVREREVIDISNLAHIHWVE